MQSDIKEKALALLKKVNMSRERYHHSLCVGKEAKNLAMHYGEDAENAEIAGLLHDVTKEFTKDEHFKIINENKIKLNKLELHVPKLWHAITAPAYVRRELKIKNRDILNAIRYHTTGKKNMTKLEKIIFLADFISEDRFSEYGDAAEAKSVAYKSLDDGVLYELEHSIKKLINNKGLLCLDTVKAYNYYTFKKIEGENSK